MRPLPAGVPVSPTMRFTKGRTFIRALKRLLFPFLNPDSSSRTTVS